MTNEELRILRRIIGRLTFDIGDAILLLVAADELPNSNPNQKNELLKRAEESIKMAYMDTESTSLKMSSDAKSLSREDLVGDLSLGVKD